MLNYNQKLNYQLNPFDIIHHRGPDANGFFSSEDNACVMVHSRLRILDLDKRADQPFINVSTGNALVYNGEIYNYEEIKSELKGINFKTNTDTEVLFNALQAWGIEKTLHKTIGMFSFAFWDNEKRILTLARDRFGVKPLFYSVDSDDGAIYFSSEIKALRQLGVRLNPDIESWSTYFRFGLYDHNESTFYDCIKKVPPASYICIDRKGNTKKVLWYNIEEHVEYEQSLAYPIDYQKERLSFLLKETIKLRNISDVPVGVCLSGGFDSSLLFSLLKQNRKERIEAFTFITNDNRYDETQWVLEMIKGSEVHHNFCALEPSEVPEIAKKMYCFQDEPYGGLPTLGMSKVYNCARELGIIVLLDGNGLDEAFAGYDYYQNFVHNVKRSFQSVQGSVDSPIRPDCLCPEFYSKGRPLIEDFQTKDDLKRMQLRDLVYTKIPRAMRFADRASMMHSIELREPFLDHRLVELGISLNREQKLHNNTGKWILRQMSESLMPDCVNYSPKRPVQTPQREWLKSELKGWTYDCVDTALNHYGEIWLNTKRVREEIDGFMNNERDNSFFVWQWISLGLMTETQNDGLF